MPYAKCPTAETVTICLTFCKDAPDSQAIIDSFLAKLALNPEWTAEEIEAVRQRLAERMGQAKDERH